jgi:hypothetical protein
MDNLIENFDDYNEYDESRRILEIIRESKNHKKDNKNKTFLTEATQPDRILLSQQDPGGLKQEETKFREVISPRVKFNEFIIYPKTGNVEWGGEFQDTRIQWNYSLDDTRGVYISCDLLRLDDSAVNTIKKLVGFYDNWANEWANKIADEYRNVGEEPETPTQEAPEEGEIGKGL